MTTLFPDLEPTRDNNRDSFDKNSPLPERLRPQSIQDFIGQSNLVSEGSPIFKFFNDKNFKNIPSMIFYGPPGTGKTTLAYLISRQTDSMFIELSAVSDGLQEVRTVIKDAKSNQKRGIRTLLFIDEIHRFTKTQQDSLLPAVEKGWVTLIAATTENPTFSIIAPLISRSILIEFKTLTDKNISKIIDNALENEKGFNNEYSLDELAKNAIINAAIGDARKSLTMLEAAVNSLPSGKKEIFLKDIEKISQKTLLKWSREDHYDVISAFIKSMRGSDPDATLHYLARLIRMGEDPRFIARRIMIAASEDVGLANSNVLQTCVAAVRGVEFIGYPEARILLSHAALEVALAPKSNSAYLGIDKALKDIDEGFAGEIPTYLRDQHNVFDKSESSDSSNLQKDYIYPHNEPSGIATQQYLPSIIRKKKYYSPTSYGNESKFQIRLDRINAILGKI